MGRSYRQILASYRQTLPADLMGRSYGQILQADLMARLLDKSYGQSIVSCDCQASPVQAGDGP